MFNITKEKIEIASEIVVIVLSLVSIIFASGIVWRVEKKLDLSFKFLLASIIFFSAGELAGFFYIPPSSLLVYFVPAAKIFFAVFLLAGMATMRGMIRRIDGEK